MKKVLCGIYIILWANYISFMCDVSEVLCIILRKLVDNLNAQKEGINRLNIKRHYM